MTSLLTNIHCNPILYVSIAPPKEGQQIITAHNIYGFAREGQAWFVPKGILVILTEITTANYNGCNWLGYAMFEKVLLSQHMIRVQFLAGRSLSEAKTQLPSYITTYWEKLQMITQVFYTPPARFPLKYCANI